MNNSKPRILITVKGGAIQSITTNQDIAVLIIDFDNFAADDYKTSQTDEAEFNAIARIKRSFVETSQVKDQALA